MPNEVYFANTSSFAIRSFVSFATLHAPWQLWLIELLYICLDRLILTLLSIRVSLLERLPETMSAQFYQHSVNTSVQCIYLHGYFGMA